VMLAAQRHITGHLLDPSIPLAAPPANVVRRQVCALSGMLANEWCPSTIAEWLPVEDAELPCSWHHQSDEGLITVCPAAYGQWAAEHARSTSDARASVPSEHLAAVRRTAQDLPRQEPVRLSIANPPAGAIYLIDPTLRSQYQTLSLRAMADAHAGTMEWTIDGRRIGASQADEPLLWPPVAVERRVIVRDALGRIAEVSIRVK